MLCRCPQSQGSAFVATLGWRAQPRWGRGREEHDPLYLSFEGILPPGLCLPHHSDLSGLHKQRPSPSLEGSRLTVPNIADADQSIPSSSGAGSTRLGYQHRPPCGTGFQPVRPEETTDNIARTHKPSYISHSTKPGGASGFLVGSAVFKAVEVLFRSIWWVRFPSAPVLCGRLRDTQYLVPP